MKSKLGRKADARQIVVANMATSLILFGKIETTLSKAKTLRPYTEKMINTARSGTLSAKRKVARQLLDKKAVAKIFDIIVPNLTKSSGFISLYKVNNRTGDGAKRAIIKLDEVLITIPQQVKKNIKNNLASSENEMNTTDKT